MKQSTFYKILFGLFVFLIFLYLRDELIKTALLNVTSKETMTTISVGAILLLSMLILAVNFNHIFSRHRLFKSMFLFFLTSYMLAIWHSLETPLDARYKYGALLLPLIGFLLFYLITIKIKNINFLILMVNFLVIGLIITYFQTFSYRSVFVDNFNFIDRSTYILLYLLPFVFCNNNNYIKWFFASIIVILLLTSFKRAGAAMAVISVITYIYVTNKTTEKNKKKYYYFLLVSIAILLIYVFSTDELYDNFLLSRFRRLPEDEGSGRINVWLTTIKLIRNSNWLELLFGHGHDQVIAHPLATYSAHNDFLEILYDYGLIVLILFVYLFIQLFKYIRSLVLIKSKFAAPLAVSFVQLFIGSSISHIILYPAYTFIFALFWGMVISATESDVFAMNRQLKRRI